MKHGVGLMILFASIAYWCALDKNWAAVVAISPVIIWQAVYLGVSEALAQRDTLAAKGRAENGYS